MKIGMISQWFDPEPGPAALPGVFAREFLRTGYEVTVLTGYPNYPDGRIYDGYLQRLRRTDREAGVVTTRVPLYPNHGRSAVGRVVNYTSFALSATAFGHTPLKDVDAVWVYNSPVTVSLPLLTHTHWGRIPFFLHVQDLWPDSLIESGMFPRGSIGALADRVIRSVVRLTESKAAVIGVISPSVKDLILSRNSGLDESRIVYAPNPADEDIFRPLSEIPVETLPTVPWAGKFTIMYAGAIGEVQGLDTLIDAANQIAKTPEIQIVLIGDGIARERLQRRARELGLRNVTFVDRINKHDVPRYMATAHVQLVSLADKTFLRHTTPSKIASLLASEAPILGIVSGDGADLIRKAGAGMVVQPGNSEALAEAITCFAALSAGPLRDYGRRGRRYYAENLGIETAAGRITKSLERVMRMGEK